MEKGEGRCSLSLIFSVLFSFAPSIIPPSQSNSSLPLILPLSLSLHLLSPSLLLFHRDPEECWCRDFFKTSSPPPVLLSSPSSWLSPFLPHTNSCSASLPHISQICVLSLLSPRLSLPVLSETTSTHLFQLFDLWRRSDLMGGRR